MSEQPSSSRTPAKSPGEQLAAHFRFGTANPNPMTAKETLDTYISIYENKFRCMDRVGWEEARDIFQTRLGNQLMQLNTQEVSKVVGSYKEFRRIDSALENVFLRVLRTKVALAKGEVPWDYMLDDMEANMLKAKGVTGLLKELWQESFELDLSWFAETEEE